MISVLIPIHNYKATDLVAQLHNQLILEKIPFEIICMEDGSDLSFIQANKEIEALKHTSIHISDQKNGSLKTRLLLADKAQYDWLLFVDADTLPKTPDFIHNYNKAIESEADVILGGIAYYSEKPDKDFKLRWKYGKRYEQVSAITRNTLPYKNIVSANMLIKKRALQSLNLSVSSKGYGFDNLFAAQLKSNNVEVLHIDNEVYHLGLENSIIYLKKKEDAAEALLYLYKNELIKNHDVSLLKLFVFLKKTRLNYIVSFAFKVLKSPLKRNLTGANPSISLLQMYRIGYLCYLDQRNKGKN